MHFKHIAVVGVGLIGGSFALAARRAGIAERITGWDNKDVLDEATARGVIDAPEASFASGGVCDADLVYLAAPVGAILSVLRTRADSFKAGAIVTDAGSTKREICRVAREALPSRVSFVGGHPMAGSHSAGLEHADADLFQGAPYALVVDETKGELSLLRVVEEIVRGIGARPVKLTAEGHDRAVARVSHAPQLLATALACAVARRRNETDLLLAGSGFSEMMRLAASRWSVWEDICRTNADEITLALDEVISEIEAARSSITSGDFDGVGAAFDEANRLIHQSWSPGDPKSRQ
jgi:prephenate dehydrogenase